jgi:hypothetical protein
VPPAAFASTPASPSAGRDPRPARRQTHVSRAMLKLHARDRAQLVVIAYQSGLVIPDT